MFVGDWEYPPSITRALDKSEPGVVLALQIGLNNHLNGYEYLCTRVVGGILEISGRWFYLARLNARLHTEISLLLAVLHESVSGYHHTEQAI